MKSRILLACLALVSSVLSAFAACAERGPIWASIQLAVQNGQPRTAIAKLETVFPAAVAEGAYGEALKALEQLCVFEAGLEGGEPKERIARLQARLDGLPSELRPGAQLLLAQWYAQHLEQNRWRFLGHPPIAGSDGSDDLATWDFAQVYAALDRHLTAALANPAGLQRTAIAQYDAYFAPGSVPDRYRPTAFDVFAHEALGCHELAAGIAPPTADPFTLNAETMPLFADVDEFLAWNPTATDERTPLLRAVRLLQQILRFHRADVEPSALLDADLARLRFGLNHTDVATAAPHYEAALRRFLDANPRHELFAHAAAALASSLDQRGERAEAHATVKRGLDAFPSTVGGARCFNQLQEFEARELTLRTERIWNAPWPTIDVSYRNLDRVYFRAVPVDFAAGMRRDRWWPEARGDFFTWVRQQTPTLAWDAAVAPTPDFKVRTEQLPVPTALPPGCYLVVASGRPDFSRVESVATTEIWVSDLAIVLRRGEPNPASGGFVVNAVTGEPVAGARVRLWKPGEKNSVVEEPAVETDADGWFPLHDRGLHTIFAEHGGQAISVDATHTNGTPAPENNSSRSHTIFLTDRGIYRPGQTVHYKGISLHVGPKSSDHEVNAREKVTVVVTDDNDREIVRLEHRTNDYGSFSGAFLIPTSVATGRIQISDPDTDTPLELTVEEYKRPKFEVEIAAPAEAPRLGSRVVVTGKARAFTGVAIDGASVSWRVQRRVSLPPWAWWRYHGADTTLESGRVTTAPDGTFRIEFLASPAPDVAARDEASFEFQVNADVTDTTGETRSAVRVMRAGFSALRASLEAGSWLMAGQPAEFSLRTQSLDGEPQAARGTFTIHALKVPDNVRRERLEFGFNPFSSESRNDPNSPDPETWETAAELVRREFATDATGAAKESAPLPAGIYRASLATTDRFGSAVTARCTFQVVDPVATRFPTPRPSFFAVSDRSIGPGRVLRAIWGTGYASGRALVEVECAGKTLARYWTRADQTQQLIEVAITPEMRGGVTLRVTAVRENRMYAHSQVVEVPWTEQQLTVEWQRFHSKLEPGGKTTWTAIVRGPNAKRAAAEMVATLYDASLDELVPFAWHPEFRVFRREPMAGQPAFANTPVFGGVVSHTPRDRRAVAWRYRALSDSASTDSSVTDDDVVVLSPFEVASSISGTRVSRTLASASLRGFSNEVGYLADTGGAGKRLHSPPTNVPSAPSAIVPRRNLRETAFFLPHLTTDRDGAIRITFTVPETLTQWRFLGFAHDKRLGAGLLTATAVTSKELMVQPNPPRFVREGDTVEFTVKVSNDSAQPQSGTARLNFFDAATLAPADAALGLRVVDQPFTIPAKQSRSFAWRITVPDGMGYLTYRATASTGKSSDGEEAALPVLSRRVLVTESLALPIRGPGKRDFEFGKLLASDKAETLRHQSLTVQMVSQPAWSAVQSLPYLMEFPHECSEQIFNRYYANKLAAFLVGSRPKLREVVEAWKKTPAAVSPLERNPEMKSVLLEETPWLRDAADSTAARRRVGELFDAPRLDAEAEKALEQLRQRQGDDGLWSWFPEGPPSEYISLYVAAGFARLRRLGADVDLFPATQALAGLDRTAKAQVEEAQHQPNSAGYLPTYGGALYLYTRSLLLDVAPVSPEQRPTVDYLLQQARKHWTRLDSRQSQAHVALALHRFGDHETALAIVNSLRERSQRSDEMGMFWRDPLDGRSWWHAPIETQALMIELFSEVAKDDAAVGDCKVWLLKQKQAQSWPTTKATADAVYALLLEGDDWFESGARVAVSLGGKTIRPTKAEAGSGFYERTFAPREIRPEQGRIQVTKTDDGVSWGSVHWQYFEDVSRITPPENSPLRVTKSLFVKRDSPSGPLLERVVGPVAVGDELFVRLELRSDRDLDYVHVKDQRASGTEPVNGLSGYRWRNGVGYYESTRDTASHFYLERLPRGTSVLEYSVRVQLRGRYGAGLAEAESMYAPEFRTHSVSTTLEVH